MQYSLVKLASVIFSLTSVSSMLMSDASFSIQQVTDGGAASAADGPSTFTNRETHTNINGDFNPGLNRRDPWFNGLWGNPSFIGQSGNEVAVAAGGSAPTVNAVVLNPVVS